LYKLQTALEHADDNGVELLATFCHPATQQADIRMCFLVPTSLNLLHAHWLAKGSGSATVNSPRNAF
jgi:hypothetical protein